jgi:hypothetical protein
MEIPKCSIDEINDCEFECMKNEFGSIYSTKDFDLKSDTNNRTQDSRCPPKPPK